MVASSKYELLGNVNYALHLFDSLGLTIHVKICANTYASCGIPWCNSGFG